MDLNKNIKISVIVPAYNYGKYLSECLQSLLTQTFTNWECIVIDNGSTDDTAQVAKKFTEKDPRFIYVYTEQKGVSFARNKAVELSKGEFILPLDADDKIAPTYLEKAEKILASDKNIKVVYCDAELFGALSGKWILPSYTLKDLLIENSIFCTALFRKSDFETAGGFNEEMKEGFEDWDFWIRMLKSGGKVYKIPEVLFYYRMRADSRNGVLYEQKQLNLRKKIYQNHKELYDATFNLPDLIFDNYNLKNELASTKNQRTLRLAV